MGTDYEGLFKTKDKDTDLLGVRSNDLLCDVDFLKTVIQAQARLLMAYRIGGQPPEWVFNVIEKAKLVGIKC